MEMQHLIQSYVNDLMDLVRTGESLPGAEAPHPENYVRPSEQRNGEMCALRAGGQTLQKIASAYGLSTTRVRQLTKHVERPVKPPPKRIRKRR